MYVVIGPVLNREGRYGFDSWRSPLGMVRSYAYRRIEDAYYARNVEIKFRRCEMEVHAAVCETVEEFTRKISDPEALLTA
jgi:hypothetical protein